MGNTRNPSRTADNPARIHFWPLSTVHVSFSWEENHSKICRLHESDLQLFPSSLSLFLSRPISVSPRSTPAPTLLFLSPKEICTKEADSFLDILSFLSWIAIRNFKWHLLQTFSRENYYFFFFIYLLTDCINLFSSRRRF